MKSTSFLSQRLTGVVAALLTPETRWVTGQRIEVTGGFRL